MNRTALHRIFRFALIAMTLWAAPALAQSASEQAGLAALAVTGMDRIPAKNIFGKAKLPAVMAPEAIGSYARGCLAGGVQLPRDGEAWQIMRPSRNRNWGSPQLVALVERLAREARSEDGWPGLLVGDIAQPRGGPMLTGHASHQIGLDADIWFTPMPDHTLSPRQREDMAAITMIKDRQTLDQHAWSESRARLIKRAASYPEVARIFVHPPIKAELCRWATGDRSWLAKVRPYFNHTYHFHIRLKCPAGMKDCKNQAPAAPKDGTGCGEELAYWMGPVPWAKRQRDPNAPPIKPAPPLTLAGLPAECRAVVTAP
jgi:penicillin-insensitive murein DD-endopeptidase